MSTGAHPPSRRPGPRGRKSRTRPHLALPCGPASKCATGVEQRRTRHYVGVEDTQGPVGGHTRRQKDVVQDESRSRPDARGRHTPVCVRRGRQSASGGRVLGPEPRDTPRTSLVHTPQVQHFRGRPSGGTLSGSPEQSEPSRAQSPPVCRGGASGVPCSQPVKEERVGPHPVDVPRVGSLT